MVGMVGVLWGHKRSEGTVLEPAITLNTDRAERCMRIVSQRKFHSWSASKKERWKIFKIIYRQKILMTT